MVRKFAVGMFATVFVCAAVIVYIQNSQVQVVSATDGGQAGIWVPWLRAPGGNSTQLAHQEFDERAECLEFVKAWVGYPGGRKPRFKGYQFDCFTKGFRPGPGNFNYVVR